MILRTIYRLAWVGLLTLIVAAVVSAMAASNSVPETGVDEDSFSITANDLKPPDCDALGLSAVVTGSGNFEGTSAAELLLGSSGADTISARGGADCALGGGGNDSLNGNAGGDVLLGGPGDDNLSGGNGSDICDGGAGTDTADSTCETKLNIP